MAVMDLFQARCRLHNGTRQSVDIWCEPWIPRIPSFWVISPKPQLAPISWVSELISKNLWEWNEELVSVLFWPEDQDLIRQIPLGLVGSGDMLVWHYKKWHLLHSECLPPSTVFVISGEFEWVGLGWNRALGGKCGKHTCQKKLKSSFGKLFEISFPQLVICRNGYLTKCSLVPFVTQRSKHPSTFSFIVPSWARNLKLARKNFLLPLQVVGFARSYFLAFMLQTQQGVSDAAQHRTSWNHPPIHSIKINFNGGLLDGGRTVGLGIIARDVVGLCLACWSSLRLNRGGSVELDEALVAREAIRLTHRFWWP
ncbi:UNVERIFIED_CONTAM: hypothetical protein Scaly_2254500 [Sesamum calycinum]|uniref:Uncharacterized protein n=1 Tax=Sesamum calycinum TaxID=2727403 RepID=A0AAW2M9N5_9LAMI